MNSPNIDNINCAVLRRSSSPTQGTSIGNQGKTIDSCIDEHHLTVVFEKALEGVTGSIPGNRTDIDEIIAEKKAHDNFRLLLVPDASRFTRAGAGHGAKLIFDLRAAGIWVLFVAENILVHDELTAMYITFLLYAAHEMAKSISRNGTNGTTQSYLNGKSPHCRKPPIGLDRMYSLEGKDLHVIRNLPDGTQEMLHPVTREVIRRFGRNAKKGVPNHYIKQKNETVRLVPGDPERIAIIHFMLRRHHIDKVTYYGITKELNDMKIPSPNGVGWRAESVRSILLNPTYVGLAIRYRKAGGIYYNGGEAAATPSGVELKELVERPNVSERMRPREEWRDREIPDLFDFAPEEVQELAKAKIGNHLDSIADGRPAPAKRDPHRQSPYVLKGILQSKQGGHKMTGRPRGKNKRSYAVSRGLSVVKSNNVLATRVPAEPIEQIVMEMMKAVFSDKSLIIAKVTKLFNRYRKLAEQPVTVEAIQKKRSAKRQQLIILLEHVSEGDPVDDPIVMKLDALQREIRQLDAQIRDSQLLPPKNQFDPKTAIEQFATDLQERISSFKSGSSVPPEDVQYVANILAMLISKLEVDLVTKELEMEFSLPSWLPIRLTSGQAGLDSVSACRPLNEAPSENRPVLGSFRCQSVTKTVCYKCRRLPKAA
jgi:DNA invertase Pin-like site-specific DNA recombinase